MILWQVLRGSFEGPSVVEGHLDKRGQHGVAPRANETQALARERVIPRVLTPLCPMSLRRRCPSPISFASPLRCLLISVESDARRAALSAKAGHSWGRLRCDQVPLCT